MTSTYSTRLRFEQQAAGDNLNTWGPKINAALLRLEEAIAGRQAISTYPITLTTANGTTDQSREMFLDCSGAGGTITIPAVEKLYFVRNNASATITVTTGSGTTATVLVSEVKAVLCDGTNVYAEFLTGAYLPLAGGTLTGGLTGTTASFSSNGTIGGTLGVTGLTSGSQFSANSSPGSTGQYAAVSGSTVAMLRNDGTNAYILKNNSSTTAYDTARPIAINLSTGAVTFDGTGVGGTSVGGALGVSGTLTSANTLVANGIAGSQGSAFTVSNTSGTYGGLWAMFNSYGSATNPYKYFRVNSTGGLEIINSAYSTGIFTLTDAGALTVSGAFSAAGISGTTGTFSSSVTATGALSGASVAGTMLAVASDINTGSSTTKVTTPAAVAGSSGHAKAWVQFVGSTATINKAFNVASVTRTGTGSYTITFTNALADGNYAITVTCQGFGGNFNVGMIETGVTPSTTSFAIGAAAVTNARTDPPLVTVTVFD